jgi:parallel beta-helix repeat protein
MSKNRIYKNARAGDFYKITGGMVTGNMVYSNKKPWTVRQVTGLKFYANKIKGASGDTNNGKTQRRPKILRVGKNRNYKDIQSAIDDAVKGDRILIDPGKYVINKPLMIKNKTKLRIRGRRHVRIISKNQFSPVIKISGCKKIIINKLYAVHIPKAKVCYGPVVDVERSKRIMFYRSVFNGCGTTGILAKGVRSLRVYKCRIYNNSRNGITVYNSKRVSIRRSRIFRNKENGIFLRNCQQVNVSRNRIYSNKSIGVSIIQNINIRVYRNTMYGNRKNIHDRHNRKKRIYKNGR